MSNNLVSQQFTIPGMQGSQLDPISNKMESSLSEVQRVMVVSASGDPSLHEYIMPNKSMELMESISGGSLSQNAIASHMPMGQMGQVDVRADNFGQQQFEIPVHQFGGTGNMWRTADGLLSLPLKRKTSAESPNTSSQQPSIQNKRVAQMEHRPWLQQGSGITKKPLQIHDNTAAPTPLHSPAAHKRKVQQMELPPTKVGHQRSTGPKGQSAQQNPASKIQNESTGSVRSKMKESLTAALALVSQQQDKSSNDEKNQLTEAKKSVDEKQENSLLSGPADPKKTVSEKVVSTGLVGNEVEKLSHKSLEHLNVSDLEVLRFNGREFPPSNVLSYEDMSFGDSFFIKDDLLQENGLSWVFDSGFEVVDGKETQPIDIQKMDTGVANQSQVVKEIQTPESLAFKIEEELFKLFGGVNKKYKEKGRSLLFNLKDRNNPELRERVMRGEITPERLCSMTAEELASKELSEWRMAKAEELAQMVVLPDSEVDIRRLVKKTHKGEFQVEVEHYDNSSTDVSAGVTSLPQSQRNKNDTEGGSSDEPEIIKDEQKNSAQKNGAENKDNYTLTIASNDGTDLMQGLIVDDGLKDTELLPPIVSLDEFMESLNSEPPFDIASEDAGKLLPTLEKVKAEVVSGSKASVRKDATSISRDKNTNEKESYTKTEVESSSIDPADAKSSGTKTDVGSNEIQASFSSFDKNDSVKSNDKDANSGAEHLWEGILQFNISTMTSVMGTYISGERISARDWPGILEIKGRVRLDAFEKFLHELPLSRSRAVMVFHLDLKEGRPESERASLQEVGESYVVDERVGIAEPGSGVEFYFCPPHTKILEMLARILLKENNEALNAIHNGLIGVVVWRKTQLTSFSPNSTSHHKRNSKKQHLTSSRRHQETNNNFKPNNLSPQNPMPPAFPVNPPSVEEIADDDDDNDVPPGFGPPIARDDDDLPEFSFSGPGTPSGFSAQKPPRGLSRPPSFQPVSQTGSRPVDQMRELVHKYGQNASNPPGRNLQERGFGGVAVQPWNDDDDDIPEWQPQAPQHQILPSPPVRGGQPPTLRPHYMVNQQQQHLGQPSQLPPNAPLNVGQQGAWWVSQPGGRGNSNIQNSSSLGSRGQFYGAFGMNPRHDSSNSRGF